MYEKNSLIMNFIILAIDFCQSMPEYFSKYSRKDFTVRQLTVLLILKQKLKCSYETLIDDLSTRPKVIEMIGLRRLPDPSTLKKFAKRLKANVLYYLLEDSAKLIPNKKLELGIDAAGLHIEDGSYHYRKRLGFSSRTIKHVKLSVAADTKTQLVTSAKLRKSNAHDNKDFIGLVKKSRKIKEIKIVTADKGYDCEKNHKYCRKEVGAESIIPPKKHTSKKHRTRGYYRKKLRKGYSKKKYHQRSKVETVFYVIKKLFGATLSGRSWHSQKIELLCKIIAYNAYRLAKLRVSP